MLSALGAALGAACSAPRDAQQLAPLLIFPVMIPIFLIVPLAQQPNGVFATVVSLIPPFTPLVMIMRQAMPGGVPAWQPWVGLAGVLACALLVTWAGARIFRVGILLQGKPPRLAELVRWAVRG
jgi:ABC-2 type transport system permease protein